MQGTALVKRDVPFCRKICSLPAWPPMPEDPPPCIPSLLTLASRKSADTFCCLSFASSAIFQFNGLYLFHTTSTGSLTHLYVMRLRTFCLRMLNLLARTGHASPFFHHQMASSCIRSAKISLQYIPHLLWWCLHYQHRQTTVDNFHRGYAQYIRCQSTAMITINLVYWHNNRWIYGLVLTAGICLFPS